MLDISFIFISELRRLRNACTRTRTRTTDMDMRDGWMETAYIVESHDCCVFSLIAHILRVVYYIQ